MSTRKTERRSFPLSFAEHRLGVLDRLEPGNGSYNLAFAVRLDGPLDPDAVQSTLDEIAGRHEILRAEFHVEGDAPCPGAEAGVGAFVNCCPSRFCNAHQAACCNAFFAMHPRRGNFDFVCFPSLAASAGTIVVVPSGTQIQARIVVKSANQKDLGGSRI